MSAQSEGKFTPGPWWLAESGVRDAGGYICLSVKAQRYEGQEERYVRETEERDANMRAIAAAPDMAESLRALLRQVGNIEVLGEWSAQEVNLSAQKKVRAEIGAVVAKARAALAKAGITP